MNRNIIPHLAIAALPSLVPAAHASSDEAWKQLAADVEDKCRKAAVAIEKPKAVVDPFGTSHYGLALVTGKSKGARGLIVQICVYDKQTESVEIGSEIDAEELGLAPAKPATAAACDFGHIASGTQTHSQELKCSVFRAPRLYERRQGALCLR